MKIPLINVKYASETKPAGIKKEGFAFGLLTAFILLCFLISPAAAATVDWQITPSSPSVGDTLKITGTAAAGADVRAQVTYLKEIPVSKGGYQLSLRNLEIPEGKDNLFTVQADGVANLHVGVNKWLTYNINKDATNGIATISQGHVPAWSYNIVIDGDALKGKNSVKLTISAAQTLTANSKGRFTFNYDTSALPAGQFNIVIGNTAKTIELKSKDPRPRAEFSGSPVEGFMPLTVNFKDLSTGSPTKWFWNFGDGKGSYSQNPTHVYNNVGKYSVSLTVWNSRGSSENIKTYYINVKRPVPPHAALTASPLSGVAPLTVSFIDASTGSPTKWFWNFGDGKGSYSQNPTHVYKDAGRYTVSLTVWNSAGSSKITKTYLITVSKLKPPKADFSAAAVPGRVPLKVAFTDKSSGVITWWKWNFGDRSTSTESNPVYTYNAAGKYKVSLTVGNSAGSSTTTKYVSVTKKSSTGR